MLWLTSLLLVAVPPPPSPRAATEDQRVANSHVLNGYQACEAKDYDACATHADLALEFDPENEAAKDLLFVAKYRGGSSRGTFDRRNPGFQSSTNRIVMSNSLWIHKGFRGDTFALGYNRQLSPQYLLVRLGGSLVVGSIAPLEDGIPIGFKTYQTVFGPRGDGWLGFQVPIGKIMAIAGAVHISVGGFVVGGPLFLGTIGGEAEFSYGRLSLFAGGEYNSGLQSMFTFGMGISI